MRISTFRHMFKPLRPREQYLIARMQLIRNARVLGWGGFRLSRELYNLRVATWKRLRAAGHPVDWEVAWWWQSKRLLKRMTPDEAVAYVLFQFQGYRPARA